MKFEAWQVMVGLSVILVLVAAITYLSRLEVTDVIIGAIMAGSIVAAMYLGWRMGKLLGNRRAG